MKGSGCSKCSGVTGSAVYHHLWSALCYILMVDVGMSMALDTSGVHWTCKLSLCKYSCRTVSHLFICMLLTMYFKISWCKIAATLERKFRRDSLFCPDELDSLFSYFDTGAGSGPRSKYKESVSAPGRLYLLALLGHVNCTRPKARYWPHWREGKYFRRVMGS